MGSFISNKSLCALVLCGGMGTRLQNTILDMPKPLAPVAGKPFLDYIMEYLVNSAVSSIVLCCGYRANDIREHYSKNIFSIPVIFSQEPLPLGTAGAVKYAEHYINNGPFLVVNGDSFARVDINAMLGFHASRNARATIALSRIDDSSDFGTVKLDNNNRIISFSEKDPAGGPAFVNAGIYLFETSVLSLIPKGVKFSLEHEVFNTITDCYGFKTDARLVDIGTKERYNEAQKIFSSKDCI